MALIIKNSQFFPLSLTLLSCSVFAEQAAVSIADPAPSTFQAESPQACITLRESAERLKCFDSFFKPSETATSVADIKTNPAQTDAANNKVFSNQQSGIQTSAGLSTPSNVQDQQAQQIEGDGSWRSRLNPKEWIKAGAAYSPEISLLDRRWELSKDAKLGTFHLKGYKPNYILPVFLNGNINDLPTSPNPDNQVKTPQDISKIEAKFQFSFKTKAWEGVIGDYGDLWIGYSQSSRWQVYNSDTSRPFRETNYEPEANLIFATNYNLLGLNGRLLGVSLAHQSNGRELPYSRGWDRVIGQIGFERDNFAMVLRPWYYLAYDKPAKDDNIDIEDYMGRGDLQAFYKYKQQEFSLMLRHTLKGGDKNRGAVQFDWAFPIKGDLRGYVQVFDGYGESMIDYNHKATYVGLGISLLNWY